MVRAKHAKTQQLNTKGNNKLTTTTQSTQHELKARVRKLGCLPIRTCLMSLA